VTAPKQVDFVDGVTVVAAEFLDRIQEIQAGLAINMALSISGTALVLPAGEGNNVSSITIGEKFRYLQTAQTLSFTASDSSGSYGIWAVTSSTDSNPSFSLEKVSGSGTPTAAFSRRVATVTWDGSSTLSGLVQLAGYDNHGNMHTLAGDPLPAGSVSSSQIVNSTIVLEDLASSLQNLLVPVGSVFPYAGTSAPPQYLLCDGSEQSQDTYPALSAAIGVAYNLGDELVGNFRLPDLRGRVPAGKDNMGGTAASRLTSAGSGIDGLTLGAAGGSQTHSLSAAQSGLPAHSVNADGGHTHAVGLAGGHSHGGGTSGVGDHTHGYTAPFTGKSIRQGTGTFTGAMEASITGSGTGGGGAHSHTIATDTVANHTHVVNGGSHTHTVTAQSASSAHQNAQPTTVLNYIIRF
jgi:microcystin-dependent protein